MIRIARQAASIEIVPVAGKREVREFIKLPYRIYRRDPHWVAPLEGDVRKLMNPATNSLLQKGPYQFILARQDGAVVGRLVVGIDEKINAEKEKSEGYIALFECVDNYEVAKTMLDYAFGWLKDRGMTSVQGPVSPSKGDDYRGLLVMGFDGPPVLMNSYNPAYYPEYFERYGLQKHLDLYAYHYDLTKELDPRLLRGVEAAKKRYGFTVEHVRLERILDELRDIKQILDEAMPEEWDNLIPPEMDELEKMADHFVKLAEPTLIPIARHGARPIGFALALPDYNQVLRRVRGRLFPFGFLKYLWYRKRITGGRIFVMFVVPDFQKKGVSAAIYVQSLLAAQQLGYTDGEGSTIGEINVPMRRDAEGVGGVHYRTYRLYEKSI